MFESRRELAQHLLHSSLELNETAYLLGYEDANSFFRAFHQWEGWARRQVNGGPCMPIAPARTTRRLRLRNSESPDSDVFIRRTESSANRTVAQACKLPETRCVACARKNVSLFEKSRKLLGNNWAIQVTNTCQPPTTDLSALPETALEVGEMLNAECFCRHKNVILTVVNGG